MITINLLPQKKKRIGNSQLLLSFVGFTWLLGAGYLGWSYADTKNEIQSLQQNIELKEKQLAAIQQKNNASAQEVTVEQYLILSEKLQHLFYPTSVVLDELAKNLPIQGKLSKVTYSLDGKINVEGRFEQYDDIASYLHNLQNSPYVLKAEVKSIGKIEVKWVGPVDEEGKPLSFALQTLGGNLHPRATASFELIISPFDAVSLAKDESKKEVAESKQIQPVAAAQSKKP
jgi:type IV pilus assembly protein PilN